MSQIDNAFETTMEKLWENKKYNTLRDVLVTMQPAQVAALFAMMPDNAPAPLFRLLPKEQAAETFVEMEPDMQEKLIRSFSDTELKSVLDELYVDDAVDLVEEMPANVVKRLLAQADPDMRKSINELLRYPEDSAGSIMTIEFVALRPQMTAADAIATTRTHKHIDRDGAFSYGSPQKLPGRGDAAHLEPPAKLDARCSSGNSLPDVMQCLRTDLDETRHRADISMWKVQSRGHRKSPCVQGLAVKSGNQKLRSP